MRNKAIFFDFDGTLWFGKYGKTTLETLNKLHENYYLFYCSGRSEGNTQFDLLKGVPFDGYFGDKRYAWRMILFYGLWSGIGYNIVLVSGAMARIPEEIVEAGKLDGLSTFKELFYVTIPLIGSTLGTLLLLGTTVIFTYFLQPQLLLGGSADTVGGYTIALYMVTNIRSAGQSQMAMGATVGVLCAIVGTPIVFVSRKLIDKFLPAYEY